MEQYTLRTDIFEGPLDLLLNLIERRKLLINDITLSEVADDYLKYLEQHKDFPVAETAQFVLIGSTLLLIKSKSLLPSLALSDDEQGSIEDLETRLKLLERYRALSAGLLGRYRTAPLYGRETPHAREPLFTPDTSTTVAGIRDAMKNVLANLPQFAEKLTEATVRKVVSLEEVMTKLTERISAGMQVSFREAVGAHERTAVIVTFLAMLELVRQGVIRVEQESRHGEILMRSDSVGLPHYG